MSKMDALNQKLILRIFRALRKVDIGIYTEDEFVKFIHVYQEDYFDDMIDVLQGDMINDNK